MDYSSFVATSSIVTIIGILLFIAMPFAALPYVKSQADDLRRIARWTLAWFCLEAFGAVYLLFSIPWFAHGRHTDAVSIKEMLLELVVAGLTAGVPATLMAAIAIKRAS